MTAPEVTFKGCATLGGQRLFAPLRLDLVAGCWTCLLGPSGVGKSTLLRLIAGLSTEAEFDGTITASDNSPVAPRVSYMAQQDLLLPWADVRANVTLGARLRGEPRDATKLDRLLQSVDLLDHGHKKPHALSGGQRQRVALARTLMEDTPIVLLDEPFSALDARNRADMQDLACDLLADKTVLLVTHDPGEAARLGDAIHIMSADGLTHVTPPAAPVPRDVSAQETLMVQAALLDELRRPAA